MWGREIEPGTRRFFDVWVLMEFGAVVGGDGFECLGLLIDDINRAIV